MDSVETVGMQSVLTDVRGGEEQNRAGSVTTNTEEDIRDGSIAKSGRSKFSIYPSECGLPSVCFCLMTGRRKPMHEDISKKRGHWSYNTRDMKINPQE